MLEVPQRSERDKLKGFTALKDNEIVFSMPTIGRKTEISKCMEWL